MCWQECTQSIPRSGVLSLEVAWRSFGVQELGMGMEATRTGRQPVEFMGFAGPKWDTAPKEDGKPWMLRIKMFTN